MNNYTENNLIERPAIRLFQDLDYEHINAYHENYGKNSLLGRQERDEVVLLPRLKKALVGLNSDAPAEAISLTMEELVRDRSAMSLVGANREIYKLIKDGVKVNVHNQSGELAVKMYEKMKIQSRCPDIAVVMSSSQNEPENFKPHRLRMRNEDLEEKFKDPDDPLKIVIVCDMWLTGFDVECLSTIYLDKPMRNHTLMQAIARANRVFGNKTNGLIVDYIGVFRDLKRALAIYAATADEDQMPVKPKDELIKQLKKIMIELDDFCMTCGFDIKAIGTANDLETIELIGLAIDKILSSEKRRLKFLSLSKDALLIFKAILPDAKASQFAQGIKVIKVLSNKIRSITGEDVDIEETKEAIGELLDESIESIATYKIFGVEGLKDLSRIDFEKIKTVINKNNKHIATERLKQTIKRKLETMVKMNPSRLTFEERFKKLIDEYNQGAKNVDELFEELIEFAKELNEEEKRGLSEQLSEEELTIFDLLLKPDLTGKDVEGIKQMAKDLLLKLKREKLVLDWRKKQQTRADVLVTIKDILYEQLPQHYNTEVYTQKCDLVYRHIYDSYYGEGKSIYSELGVAA